MLSYRHAYHAGNFADVLKHVVLVQSLTYLCQKPGPLHYIDTHAGAGTYSLTSAQANKVAEYQGGIQLLWGDINAPEALKPYLNLVRQYNTGPALRTYPGSPWFAQQILRPQDRLDLCELHPKDFELLKEHFKADKRIHCYCEDGFEKSRALTPPVERRGLIFTDPSYEIKQDYRRVVEHVKSMHRNFATGVVALWYPLVQIERTKKLEKELVASGIRKIQLYEVSLTSDHETPGMTGASMMVINPPWTLAGQMEEALAYLTPLFNQAGNATYRVATLVGD